MAKVNADRFRKRAQEHKSEGGQRGTTVRLEEELPYFKPKAGVNKLDFVPYEVTDRKHPDKAEVGELWPRRPIKVHFNVGIDEKAVLCPLTLGKPCPICAHRKTAALDEEGKKALLPKDRELWLVVPHDGDDAGKLHLWEYSYHLFGKMLEEEVEANEDYAGFYDPKEGLTLKVRFSEKKMGKRTFLEAKRIDFEDREGAIPKKIVESAPNLDDCLVVLDYPALEAMFLGLDGPGEDEDEEPKGKGKPKDEPKSGKKSKDEDEEEEPKGKGKGKKSKDEDECPHGGVFGKEFDEYKECDDCSERKPCKKAKAAMDDDEDEDEEPKGKGKPKDEPKSGKKSKDEDEDEEPKGKGKPKGKKDDECPHGGTYGEDCNTLDECDKCDVWDECQERKREIRRAAKAGK